MYHGERFNSITHLVGAALSLMGLGALVTVGVNSGNTKTINQLYNIWSEYGSTLYHVYLISQLSSSPFKAIIS